MGHFRPRQRGLRNLDEDGHAVHRQLEPGARLEDHAADHSPRAYRPRGTLDHKAKTTCTSFPPKRKWSASCAKPAPSAKDISNTRAECIPTNIFKCRSPCGTTSTNGC